MRFIVADWGTTRFRGYLIENETILDQVSSDEGVSALQKGQHRDVFLRQCGHWLKAEPDAPVLLVGMVGSREGWVEAPYATCPAGPEEIARALEKPGTATRHCIFRAVQKLREALEPLMRPAPCGSQES